MQLSKYQMSLFKYRIISAVEWTKLTPWSRVLLQKLTFI